MCFPCKTFPLIARSAWQRAEYQSVLKKIEIPTVNHLVCQTSLVSIRLGNRCQLSKTVVWAGGGVGKNAYMKLFPQPLYEMLSKFTSPATLSGWWSPAVRNLSIIFLNWFSLELEVVEGETNNLKTLQTHTITNEECRARVPENELELVQDKVICTLNPPGQGLCGGDPGGALVIGIVVVGVTSWGVDCSNGFPDDYSRVSSHNSWILSHVGA